MSRPYRTDKPIDSVEVPLSTVRGLYVLLGRLMERYADTPILTGCLEEGLCGINALTLWDTTNDCIDANFALILHSGPYPDKECQNPALLKEFKT